jgi:rRNA maturation endonuclease Nob1
MVDFLLLTFLPFVYLPVMAFNQDFTFKEDVEVTPNAYIDEIQSSSFKDEVKKKTAKKKKMCDKCGEPLSNTNKFCPNCGKKI